MPILRHHLLDRSYLKTPLIYDSFPLLLIQDLFINININLKFKIPFQFNNSFYAFYKIAKGNIPEAPSNE